VKVDYSITLPSDLGAQARRELTRILENHATAIDGATSKTISGQYSSIQLVSDGAVWHII
jgi:hypothetical protein